MSGRVCSEVSMAFTSEAEETTGVLGSSRACPDRGRRPGTDDDFVASLETPEYLGLRGSCDPERDRGRDQSVSLDDDDHARRCTRLTTRGWRRPSYGSLDHPLT